MQDIRLYKGDQRAITLETGFDWTNIGTGSSRSVKIVKPDLTTATQTGTSLTVVDATNGVISIVLAPDQVGDWMVQPSGTDTATKTFRGSVTVIRVSDIL